MSLSSVEDVWALLDRVAAVDGTERIPLDRALGRVLAEPIAARYASPNADVSTMDGYAVRSEDVGGAALTLVGTSAAGQPWNGALAVGHACRIATGACLPAGADMVVAQEDTELRGDALHIAVERIRIGAGTFVRPLGSDLRRDDVVLAGGTRLGLGQLTLAGAAGHATVLVRRRPRVAVLSSGDELVPIGSTPSTGQVISTNALMLSLQCERAGAELVAQLSTRDDRSAFDRALAAAAAADLLLTSGGASVGDRDLVRERVAALGGRELVWGIAMRPGKPLGVVDRGDGRWILALPGNPASSFVTAELFARPWIRRLSGELGDVVPQFFTTRAATALPGAGDRVHFVRARHTPDGVAALADQTSGNARSLAGADALARVPPGRSITVGESCEVTSLTHLLG